LHATLGENEARKWRENMSVGPAGFACLPWPKKGVTVLVTKKRGIYFEMYAVSHSPIGF
jgi:hypothetical protein